MNTETKQVGHTPGEWSYEKDTETFYEGEKHPQIKIFSNVAGRTLIADLSQFTVMFPDKKEEAEANARLIAAAPAMYKTLQEMVDFIQKLYQIKAFNTRDNFSLVNEGQYLRKSIYNIANKISNQ